MIGINISNSILSVPGMGNLCGLSIKSSISILIAECVMKDCGVCTKSGTSMLNVQCLVLYIYIYMLHTE